MSTVRDILKKSLWLSGVVGTGQTPPHYLYAEALSSLNMMLDSWSAFTKNIHVVTRNSLTLTSGDADYSIGSGADLDTARPIQVFESFITIDSTDFPVEVVIREQYDRISTKTTSERPVVMYYEPSFPNGTIRFYPVPDAAYALTLVSLKPLITYALGDSISLPPGYEAAITYGLAVFMAPGFGKELRPDIVSIANNTLEAVRANNTANQLATMKGLNPIRGRGVNVSELFNS